MSERKRSVSEEPNIEDVSSLLRKLYYDPEVGLAGADNLYKIAKQQNAKITKKQVAEFLKKQEANQVHSQVKHIKHFFPIKSNGPNQILNADLMDVSNMAHKNKRVNYLLCVIDIFTRLAYVRTLTKKTAAAVTDAFVDILNERKEQKLPLPKVLKVDVGSEFISRGFKQMLSDNGIEPSYAPVADHHSQGVIERFNKSLRALMHKYMTVYKTENYVDRLQDLVKNYNSRPHTSLGKLAPVSFLNPKSSKFHDAEDNVRSIIADKENKAEQYLTQFDIGAQVRFIKNKVMWEKGSSPTFSAVHTITEQKGREYLLSNGSWKKYYELQPVIAVESFVPPVQPPKPPSEHIRPKKERLFLQKEGLDPDLEKNEIVAVKGPNPGNSRSLRSRKPTSHTVTNKGERLIL